MLKHVPQDNIQIMEHVLIALQVQLHVLRQMFSNHVKQMVGIQYLYHLIQLVVVNVIKLQHLLVLVEFKLLHVLMDFNLMQEYVFHVLQI